MNKGSGSFHYPQTVNANDMYNKRLVFWAACFGMLLFGAGLITLGSMAPDLREKFGLDDVSAGTLFSILPIGILVGSLLFGPVCDRYGYKLLLVLACLAMFAGFQGIAGLSSLSLLRGCIFMFGVGAGVINGSTNAVVSDISKGSEGANLSLLGVFFGLGALGMPVITGLLKQSVTSWQIVQAVSWLTLAVAAFYVAIRFPQVKKAITPQTVKQRHLFREGLLYFIAFYLFFQGSIEAILNNWTTTYTTKQLGISERHALYALSLYVGGMSVMRLLIGSVFRKVSFRVLMTASLGTVLVGILLLHFGHSYTLVLMGLILLGAGLAAGFPIMLGLAGSRFTMQPGTAFSFIFTVSLLGNMLINYLMGLISKNYGIRYFTAVAFAELLFMIIFLVLIARSVQPKRAATPPAAAIQEATA